MLCPSGSLGPAGGSPFGDQLIHRLRRGSCNGQRTPGIPGMSRRRGQLLLGCAAIRPHGARAHRRHLQERVAVQPGGAHCPVPPSRIIQQVNPFGECGLGL